MSLDTIEQIRDFAVQNAGAKADRYRFDLADGALKVTQEGDDRTLTIRLRDGRFIGELAGPGFTNTLDSKWDDPDWREWQLKDYLDGRGLGAPKGPEAPTLQQIASEAYSLAQNNPDAEQVAALRLALDAITALNR